MKGLLCKSGPFVSRDINNRKIVRCFATVYEFKYPLAVGFFKFSYQIC